MRARGLLPILLLNVIVSVVVAFGIIAVFNNRDTLEPESASTLPFLIVTATTDPNVTPVYIVVTATPGVETTPGVTIPPDALAGAGITPGATSVVNVPTDATANPDGGDGGEAAPTTGAEASDLPNGCIYHTIESGDIISFLGPEYGVSYLDIMAVNNFTEEDAVALDVGDVIIIPLEGCPLEEFVQATVVQVEPTDDAESADTTETPGEDGTPAPDATNDGTPTVRPTVTLPPTATDSMIEIVQVTAAGDITRESVSIRNNGMFTDISDWTLNDLDGNTYTFREVLFFSEATITVNTRGGTDTAITYYQGEDQAIFSSGDVLTLSDADGVVQSTYRVP